MKIMDLEKLLREKPFELLNQDERNLVLEEMTIQEYAGMRRAALQAEKYFRKNLPPKPRPEIQARVREQMRFNQEKTLGGRIMRLIQYKIPAYQVAAAVVLLMVGMMFSVPEPSSPFHHDGVKVSNVMDTTFTDTSTHKGINLYEDSIFSRYLIEAL